MVYDLLVCHRLITDLIKEFNSLIFYFIYIMLYLFGSGSYKNERKILKVGFTDDFETREQSYKLHNPLGVMLDVREGNKILELKLHLRLKDWQVEFLDEWFYDEPEVYKIFQLSEDEIDIWLWENKSETLLYPFMPDQGTMKREILDNLQQKFNKNFKKPLTSEELEALKLL